MNTSRPATDFEDAALFEALDRYCELLQAGDRSAAGALLQLHPPLRGLARCLDALEDFAGSAAGRPARPATGDELSTIVNVVTADRPSNGDLHSDNQTPFGQYELLGEIGRGGMGVVYKARQRDLNRIVALKMILSSQLAADEDVRRFYREARAAGRLRHPHIVGIHEVGNVHGQHYFAMEYIAGRSLSQWLKSGPLPPEQAATCLSAVARAVDYLHVHGILHRDLKPSNILIDDSNNPFVTDFGLAKIFQEDDDRTQTGVILGTPGYMAPEQAAGRVSEISPRSDVYSLGTILYEMLCGRPPFRDDNPLNTILQVLESEPTQPNRLNPRVPPALERICLRCLEKAPERRYATAAELADELDRYLRHEPLETQAAGTIDRLRRWVRRDAGLVARLAILAATETIVEVWHLLSERHWAYHLEIKIVFVVWAALAIVFQRLLRQSRTADTAKLAWALTDPLLLTVVLALADGNIGPLMIGFPLVVVASGLWFSRRLVAVSTVVSIVSFCGLLVVLRAGSGESPYTSQPHYPLIFVTALLVVGAMVAYQVHRFQILSRYFEQSPATRQKP